MLTPIAPSSTLLFSRYITWQAVVSLCQTSNSTNQIAHTRAPSTVSCRSDCACCFPLWKLCRSGRLLRYSRDALKLQRQMREYERGSAVHVNRLPGDPRRLGRANQRHRIADIQRRSKPAHRSPSAFLPFSDTDLKCLGQSVQHAIFHPSRADRIHRNSAPGKGDGKVPNERFHRSLARTHRDPRLPTAKSAARRKRDCDDPPAVRHKRSSLTHRHKKRPRLRIDGRIPLLQGNFHRRLIEQRRFRPRIVHKNIEPSKFRANTLKHPADLV